MTIEQTPNLLELKEGRKLYREAIQETKGTQFEIAQRDIEMQKLDKLLENSFNEMQTAISIVHGDLLSGKLGEHQRRILKIQDQMPKVDVGQRMVLIKEMVDEYERLILIIKEPA